MSVTLREECDCSYPGGSCLRNLAAEIASTGWAQAKALGLLTARPAPYNLLSNGETGSGWLAPTQLFPNDLVAWKHAANGFTGPTQRGFALMFDPFVDACLLIEARKSGGPFKAKTKVLVLTDYGPLKNVIGGMAVLPGKDWAEVETGNFFKARNLGLTGNNLFKCLLKKDSIKKVQGLETKEISDAFGSRNLLIWNYFPCLRGGNDCEGMEGLPDSKNCAWLLYCDELLGRFVNCVNADLVLFATNRGVKEARKNCGLLPIGVDLDHPRSWLGDTKIERWGAELRKHLPD